MLTYICLVLLRVSLLYFHSPNAHVEQRISTTVMANHYVMVIVEKHYVMVLVVEYYVIVLVVNHYAMGLATLYHGTIGKSLCCGPRDCLQFEIIPSDVAEMDVSFLVSKNRNSCCSCI